MARNSELSTLWVDTLRLLFPQDLMEERGLNQRPNSYEANTCHSSTPITFASYFQATNTFSSIGWRDTWTEAAHTEWI